MAAVYLDSSAIVKLVKAEAESPALRRWLRRRGPLVSSDLARVEVHRAVLPLGAALTAKADRVLGELLLLQISATIVSDAAALQPTELRSLDAIHLASAQALGSDLAAFVTYDRRLLEAAALVGVLAVSPA